MTTDYCKTCTRFTACTIKQHGIYDCSSYLRINWTDKVTPAKKEYYKFKAEVDACYGGLLPEVDDYVTELETELAALRERTRWISVQERLPELPGYYIVFRPLASEGARVSREWFGGNRFAHGKFSRYAEISHWQPLPAGPEVKP